MRKFKKRRFETISLATIACVGILGFSTRARAQEAMTSLPSGEAEAQPTAALSCANPTSLRHVLGGHNFLPVLSIPAPFVDTETSLAFLGAIGDYPSLGLGLTEHLRLGGFEPFLNIQYALIPRLALSVGTSANLISGITTSSMLVYGASIERQWNVGILGGLLETNRMQLSLGLVVQFPHYLALTPSDLIAQLNRDVGVALPDFNDTNVSAVWRPSLRFAYSFNPTIGLLALLGGKIYTLSQSTPGQGTAALLMGIGANADLKPGTGVPLGLTANYLRNQVIESNTANSDTFSFGLYETLWTQVSFGLEVGFGDSVGQDTTLAALNARVYY